MIFSDFGINIAQALFATHPEIAISVGKQILAAQAGAIAPPVAHIAADSAGNAIEAPPPPTNTIATVKQIRAAAAAADPDPGPPLADQYPPDPASVSITPTTAQNTTISPDGEHLSGDLAEVNQRVADAQPWYLRPQVLLGGGVIAMVIFLQNRPPAPAYRPGPPAPRPAAAPVQDYSKHRRRARRARK